MTFLNRSEAREVEIGGGHPQHAGELGASVPKYAEYKDSGIAWLGEIPSHWSLRRADYLFTERVEKGFPNEVLLAATQTKGVVPKELYESRTVVAQKDLHLLKLVRNGDFVISLRSFQGGIEYAHFQGIISPAYTVLQPSNAVCDDYFRFLFKSHPFVDSLSLFVTGIRQGQNIDYQELGDSLLPLPSTQEQSLIARFLDHHDRLVRRFIRAKRRQIELLNEQKQVIIHEAVTRGLDPNVRLKPSGVEWLGDVPEHWKLAKLKHTSAIVRGSFSHRPRNDPALYDGPYPFIQTGGVANAKKHITTYTQTLNERGLAVSKLFPKGTLVMTIAANIGDVAILGLDACFPDSVVGFLPSGGMDRDYLYVALKSMKNEFLKEAPVNTQGNLNVERIGGMMIPTPPLGEQVRINRWIDQRISAVDLSIELTQREIDLILEYRTRLIADVVTGKLDVRGVELREIDEDEALDPWDESAGDEEDESADDDDDNILTDV